MSRKEARRDKLHQNYLKREANGKQKEYEERTKAKKKAQIESKNEQIRADKSRGQGKGRIFPCGSAGDTEGRRIISCQEAGSHVK